MFLLRLDGFVRGRGRERRTEKERKEKEERRKKKEERRKKEKERKRRKKKKKTKKKKRKEKKKKKKKPDLLEDVHFLEKAPQFFFGVVWGLLDSLLILLFFDLVCPGRRGGRR